MRPSDCVEAAARCNKSSSDAKGFDCAMVLDRSNTLPVGLDAPAISISRAEPPGLTLRPIALPLLVRIFSWFAFR